jgi:superfamily II DNA or RNA helicase
MDIGSGLPLYGDRGRPEEVVCSEQEHATDRTNPSQTQEPVTLLPFQLRLCEEINRAYAAGRRRPLLVVRTAGGKTITAVEMIRQAIAAGGRVLVIVHTEELVAQTSRRLIDAGLGDHGFH